MSEVHFAAKRRKQGSANFASSQLAISTPHMMKRFERLNEGKTYDHQIKPFNFCIVGFSNDVEESTGKPIKPLAPYRKNAQQCPYDSFLTMKAAKS